MWPARLTLHYIDPLHVTSLIKLITAAAILEDQTHPEVSMRARTACTYIFILSTRSRKIMVNFCAVVGCSNRADKHKGIGFYRLPAIISHQGSQTYELTCKRRDLWLSRLHREDLVPSKYPYVRLCSRHFISGKR